MPLPSFSKPAAWSAFLKNPKWSDVADEQIVIAFRKFQLEGRALAARILSGELAERVAAYASAVSPNEALAADTLQDCFRAMCDQNSDLGWNLCINTEHFVHTRARYLRKLRKIERTRYPALTPILEDTSPDLGSLSPEDQVFLRELLDAIDDPRERAAYTLLLRGHKVSGKDSIASNLGVKEHAARALVARVRAKAHGMAGRLPDAEVTETNDAPEDKK